MVWPRSILTGPTCKADDRIIRSDAVSDATARDRADLCHVMQFGSNGSEAGGNSARVLPLIAPNVTTDQ